jgi:hypothetical protein
LLARENEVAEVVEIRGVVGTGLDDVLAQMREISLGGRTRRPLYHASISPEANANLTREQWAEAADELERGLGLSGHQRAIVRHVKKGREHIHVVWNRVNLLTLRAVHDGQSYTKHEACARLLEDKFCLPATLGVHSRPPGTRRPVAKMTDADRQAAERVGQPVADIAAILTAAWNSTATGKEFATAIGRQGICLASGRRGIVAVHLASGVPHSIPRRLGLRAAEVQARLSDIDQATLLTVEQAKARIKQSSTTRRPEMPASYGATCRRPRRRDQKTIPPLAPAYWEAQGYKVERLAASLLIRLSPTMEIEDRGDRLLLHRRDGGAPTDAELRILVAAAKAHMDGGNWDGVRFFGPPADQRRMKTIALAMGIPVSAISLECEEAPGIQAPSRMPNHVRRRLNPSPAPGNTPPAGEVPPPASPESSEVRP